MIVREKYVGVVESIAKRANVLWPAGNYRISVGASRRECIQYALRHVVRHTKPHYRYDKYRYALWLALDRSALQTQRSGPALLHVDLGCGPGLFTWVVRDWFSREPLAVDLYGYDHAKEMARLAAEIWTELGEGIRASWHDDADQMLSTALAGDFRRDHSLVTFGHVLAQTHDQDGAIQRFAQVISRLVEVNCLVVAVDAYSAFTRFRRGCDSLHRSLQAHGLRVDVLHRSGQRFLADVKR